MLDFVRFQRNSARECLDDVYLFILFNRKNMGPGKLGGNEKRILSSPGKLRLHGTDRCARVAPSCGVMLSQRKPVL